MDMQQKKINVKKIRTDMKRNLKFLCDQLKKTKLNSINY